MRDLIYTCASGDYCGYAELFYKASRRAYPDAEVQVERIANVPKGAPYYAAVQRFLTSWAEYDRVYITDVDMIHLKTPGNLFDYHQRVADMNKSCYSNTRRRSEPFGDQRMTGLHCCFKGWWEVTALARRKAQELLDQGKIGGGKYSDEMVLMVLVQDAGLPVLQLPGVLSDRHYGIHLGTIRDYMGHGMAEIRSQLMMRITPAMAREWVEIQPEMMKSVDGVIQEELSILTRFCKSWAKAD